MTNNTLILSILLGLSLSLSACTGNTPEKTETKIPLSPTSCVAPQVMKDGKCETPNITTSPVQVKIEAVTGVTIQLDYKIITTNGDEIAIVDINNTNLAAIEPNERQAVVLVDKNKQPRLAAMRFDTTKIVDINLDSTTLYFILNHPLMLGQNLTNSEMIELLDQIKNNTLFKELKDAVLERITSTSVCPLQHDCNVIASDAAEELLSSLPLFAKAQ